jgi:hypothetical protein
MGFIALFALSSPLGAPGIFDRKRVLVIDEPRRKLKTSPTVKCVTLVG